MHCVVPSVAVLAAAIAAQEPRNVAFERPEAVDLAAAGIAKVMVGGGAPDRIAALDFTIGTGTDAVVERLPFAAPVREVAVGRYPDGCFVVLAGGVKDGLDVYRFDVGSRAQERHPTDGGRRLASTFARGLGSWPVDGGDGILLFAFERDERIQFHAVGPRGLFASRELPLDCGGFDATYDPLSREIGLRFVGPAGSAIEEFSVLDPGAPRLRIEQADPGGIDFGAVAIGTRAVHRIVLHNVGTSGLVASVSVAPGFEATGLPALGELTLAAGAARAIELGWTPRDAGPVRGVFQVASPIRTARAVIELKGVGVAPVTPAGSDPGAAAAVPAPAEGRQPAVVQPTIPPPDFVAPDAIGFAARWLDGGRVRITVLLDPADASITRIALRDPDVDVVVYADVFAGQPIDVTLPAVALDRVEIAAVGAGGAGPFRMLGELPPALRLERGFVVVHARAAAPFTLDEVVVDAAGTRPIRVLRSWRGRTDPRGEARFAADAFAGIGALPIHLVVAVDRPGGGRVHSRVLEVGANAPRVHSDRQK